LAGDQQHAATAVGHGGDALGGECLDLPDAMIGKKWRAKNRRCFRELGSVVIRTFTAGLFG
jgi:hypothetical protein